MSDNKSTSPAPAEAATESTTNPPLPARPRSPFSKALDELSDAFPDNDPNVRRAILVAAGSNLEHAFNGMLALTDDTIRPAPPTPARNERQTQIERDEELARQLARGSRPSRPSGEYTGRYQDTPPAPVAPRQDDANFDEIRDQLQKGWTETSKKVGSFFNDLRTRISNEMQADEEPDEDFYGRVDRPRPSHRGSSFDEPPVPPPKPKRPSKPDQKVNVFGDDRPTRWEPLAKSKEPDTDAFFIGESDEDLDSLDEEPKASPDATKAAKLASSESKVNEKAVESDIADIKDKAAAAEEKAGVKAEDKTVTEDKPAKSDTVDAKPAKKDQKKAKVADVDPEPLE